jgi:hypothetical protein
MEITFEVKYRKGSAGGPRVGSESDGPGPGPPEHLLKHKSEQMHYTHRLEMTGEYQPQSHHGVKRCPEF